LALYIDSSFILNIIYSEMNYEEYIEIFNLHKTKFSSILLDIETNRSINHFYNLKKKELGKPWLTETEKILNELLSQISLKNVDFDIQLEIKKNKSVLELKSLDATHMATAIYLKKMISEDLIICTLDEKFRSISNKFNFKLSPNIKM
jgi:predicted nucleic acid-binding protein